MKIEKTLPNGMPYTVHKSIFDEQGYVKVDEDAFLLMVAKISGETTPRKIGFV